MSQNNNINQQQIQVQSASNPDSGSTNCVESFSADALTKINKLKQSATFKLAALAVGALAAIGGAVVTANEVKDALVPEEKVSSEQWIVTKCGQMVSYSDMEDFKVKYKFVMETDSISECTTPGNSINVNQPPIEIEEPLPPNTPTETNGDGKAVLNRNNQENNKDTELSVEPDSLKLNSDNNPEAKFKEVMLAKKVAERTSDNSTVTP